MINNNFNVIGKKMISHWSPVQTEKSQPSCQRVMPERRLTKFAALSVYPRVWISRSASEIDDRFYLSSLRIYDCVIVEFLCPRNACQGDLCFTTVSLSVYLSVYLSVLLKKVCIINSSYSFKQLI